MAQNKKMSLVAISKKLDTVLQSHFEGQPVFREMADRIEMRRNGRIDDLIEEHAPELDDDSFQDFIDEVEFDSENL